MAEASAAVAERLGYTLRVAASGIAHGEAGEGLYVVGVAPPGSIVALYPGVAYPKDQHRLNNHVCVLLLANFPPADLRVSHFFS